ncbi:hypothetical protein C8R44DRAFT_877205 [Mycena epipterygia]|nr:hypothetical protein C8R44DRAFT_877205 [Mycena epipterygia]
MPSIDAEPAVKCDRCPYSGPQSTFPQKINLTYNKSCFTCKKKQAEERAKNRACKNDTNDADEAAGGPRRAPPIQPTEGYTTLEWQECVALLDAHKNNAFELEAFVSLMGESATAAFGELKAGKDVADKMAQLLWNITGYRFIYKKSKKSSTSDSAQTYTYYWVLEGAFAKIENIGGDIGRDKRRRKNPRTWDDNNANTMYLD